MKTEKEVQENNSRVDLLFDVKGNPTLYAALRELASRLGLSIPTTLMIGRDVVRLTFKNGEAWDQGCGSGYPECRKTYVPANGYNPIWIGKFGPNEVVLPNIGEHKVIATADVLKVGGQEIKWATVEKILAARPTA